MIKAQVHISPKSPGGRGLTFVFPQPELELVKSFGVPAQDVIVGGACKQLSLIKHAAKRGVRLLVCDNEAEMRKIARCHPNAK